LKYLKTQVSGRSDKFAGKQLGLGKIPKTHASSQGPMASGSDFVLAISLLVPGDRYFGRTLPVKLFFRATSRGYSNRIEAGECGLTREDIDG
jgi:hypothetical protein